MQEQSREQSLSYTERFYLYAFATMLTFGTIGLFPGETLGLAVTISEMIKG